MIPRVARRAARCPQSTQETPSDALPQRRSGHRVGDHAGVATVLTVALALAAYSLAVPTIAEAATTPTVVSTNVAQASPTPVPSSVPTTDDCSAAAPGQVMCLSKRRTNVTEPAGIRKLHAHQVTAAANPYGLSPANLAAAYALDITRGSGQTVAIVDAYDDPNAEADLATYRSQYNLGACTSASGCFRKVNENGAASPLPAADSGWSGEISLDLDMVSAVCPKCKILLVEATPSVGDLATAVDTAVALGAKFVSNSYGTTDGSGLSYYASHWNHPGVAITASTGDSGYGVEFPASASTVTAVGGTTLSQSSSTRGWTETAWSGAGSGCSSWVSQPSFQTASMTGCAKRAVADVSAVANPATGVAVYDTYQTSGWMVYGGTSVASPIIASVYALAGAPGANDYPNAYPYRGTTGLNDITSGSNGSCSGSKLCTATTGWDGPTGLGTPNGLSAFSASAITTTFSATATVGTLTPGSPAALNVTATLPSGDSVASVSWSSSRSDCTFASATSATTTVTCPSSATGSVSFTATVTDALHTTKTATAAGTFVVMTGSPVTVALSLGGLSTPASFCSTAPVILKATVTNATSGAPIANVPVTFSTLSGSSGTDFSSVTSGSDGTASVQVAMANGYNFSARSAAITGQYVAASSATLVAQPITCTENVSGSLSSASVTSGALVTVQGVVSRAVSSVVVPAIGAGVQIKVGSTVVASTSTASNGSYQVGFFASASGAVTVTLPSSTAYNAVTSAAGTLTVATVTQAPHTTAAPTPAPAPVSTPTPQQPTAAPTPAPVSTKHKKVVAKKTVRKVATKATAKAKVVRRK